MNGDAKSPKHTVVHPMYVSYSCIPTSASATISPKHTQINNHTTTATTTTATTTNHHNYNNLFGVNNNFNKSSNNALNTNSSMSSLYNTNFHQQRRRLSNLSNPSNLIINNNNNNHSNNIINNRPDIRYTELSTEQLVQNLVADRERRDHHASGHENYLLKSFRQNDHDEQNSYAIHNVGYIPQERPNRTNNLFAYSNNNNNSYLDHFRQQQQQQYGVDDDDEYDEFESLPSSTPPPPPPPPPPSRLNKNQYFAKHLNNNVVVQSDTANVEKYVMPTSYHYVARSPNLNRTGSSSRRRHADSKPHINFVDKIRDAPPGYVSMNNYSSIQRTKSQDRLSQRRQHANAQRARPRSYCSNNGNNFPENL